MKPIVALKILSTILFSLALVGVFVGFAMAHSGALQRAWAAGLRHDFEELRKTPEYHEPTPVRNYTYGTFIEDMELSAKADSKLACAVFFTCGFIAIYALTMRLLCHRIHQSEAQSLVKE